MGNPKHHDDDDDENSVSDLDKTSVIPSDTFKVRIAQAGQAPPCVVLLVGPATSVGRQWPIEDTNRILGRAEGSHIMVEDKSLSKSHAKIIIEGGDASIIDLESTNKTVVNGNLLEPLVPHRLRNNDQIKMGNIIFKYLEKGNIETVSTAQTFDRGVMDPMLGIANKGALESKALDFYKKASLLGVPFSVVTFDIDHFKQVNDTYGHSAGDFVLKTIAHIIRDTLIRENDFFARSGGEEFCVLMLGGALNHAQDVAERIRLTLESHQFTWEDGVIPITVSAGVSTKGPADQEWKDIFERADKALYQSKHNGRNLVTTIE